VNEGLGGAMTRFFEIYFELFYAWDESRYNELLDIEDEVLNMLSSLELERDSIKYDTAYEKFEKVLLKYRMILCNKYDKELNCPKNAPKAGERLH
jgi:hypothetical protein